MTTGQTFPWDGAGSEPRGKQTKTTRSPRSRKKKPAPHQSNGLLARLNQAAAGKRDRKRTLRQAAQAKRAR